MKLYDTLRNIKKLYKRQVKKQAGKYLSPVRRIERVAPISTGRFCAMTFDDGPNAAPTNPQNSELPLTECLLETLNSFGAKGTFDVIGTTADNYPDEAGPIGSFTWGGKVYDHYPDLGADNLGGALNQPELIKKMLETGHEISSHTYRHILFGENRIIYRGRKFYPNIHKVIEDLKELDKLLLERDNYRIRLSRPPHYIDKTMDGYSAYDAYRYMNYQYMAASFDGGGWQVSGDYQKDVADMITPMENVLASDEDFLNGQIIFQKDGCNMSKETPIADALPAQLELLSKHGYKVITVSQLLEMSPFEDVGDNDSIHKYAKALINAGYCIAHKNNSLQPDKPMTIGELLMMTADPSEHLRLYKAYVDSHFSLTELQSTVSKSYAIKPSHPYFFALVYAVRKGIMLSGNPDDITMDMPLTHEFFADIASSISGKPTRAKGANSVLTKRDILEALARHCLQCPSVDIS